MARLINFLLLAALISPVSALQIIHGSPVSGGGSCGSFNTGGTAHEDFDGTDDLTWTDNSTGACTISRAESSTPASTCGFDTDWMSIDLDTGSWNRCQTYYDYGSTLSEVYVRFFLYINDEGLADGEEKRLLITGATTYSSGDGMLLTQTSGQLYLTYNFQGWSEADSVAVSTGQAYCVEFYKNDSTNAWDWRVTEESGGTYGTPSSEGSGTNANMGTHQYFQAGDYTDASTNITFDYRIDNFDVDTTGWLGCDDG